MENQKESENHDFDSMDCSLLSDYIVQTHHQYETQVIQEIRQMADKVVTNASNHDSFRRVKDFFQQLSNELLLHLKKEELVLFPYIKKLALAESVGDSIEQPVFKTIKSPLSVIEMEHETLRTMLEKLSRLSNDFTPPRYSDSTFVEFYEKLREFYLDLLRHSNLENDTLFPRAVELEHAVQFA